MIYLDNAATTQTLPGVADTVKEYSERFFYNPSSTYKDAALVKRALDETREIIAANLGVSAGEIFFTSGATEANNQVLFGVNKYRGAGLVISAGEHASVYNAAAEQTLRGVPVTAVSIDGGGRADFAAFKNALNADTGLVSVIHAGNETGGVNDILRLAAAVREAAPRALFHSDGVQAFLKRSVRLSGSGVDFYTVSAHKIGGPKGVGALYVRKGALLKPLLYGGGQEGTLRSGTENVPAIMGFGRAALEFKKIYSPEKMLELKTIVTDALNGAGVKYSAVCGTDNGTAGEPDCLENILALVFPGIKSEVLQNVLYSRGVIIGLGSACAGKNRENRVLKAAGYSKSEGEGSARLSFSPMTTTDEARTAAKELCAAVKELQR